MFHSFVLEKTGLAHEVAYLDLSTLSLVAAVKAVMPRDALDLGKASRPCPAMRFALWAAFFLLNILLHTSPE